MTLLVSYLALALGVSFLCSLLEASLLSVSMGHVSALAGQGAAGSRLMLSYKERPDRPLAAILSCNTVAHTIGAAGVGAQVVAIWGDRWLGIASGLLTILILFLTEIVPKTLGTIHANRLVPFTALTIRAMIIGLYPLVVAAEFASKMVTGRDEGVAISREEVAAIADLGKRGGTLSAGEASAIRNLLSLRSIQVTDIMTPRTVVEHVPDGMTVGEFASSSRETLFARMPVTRAGNVDDVAGMIHRAMIFDAIRKGEDEQTFREMMRPLGAIPETATASSALASLLQQKEHMLLVVDEYGGTSGVVTLEDVMETLLGVEIVDETDRAVDMRELARKLQAERVSRRRARVTSLPAPSGPSGSADSDGGA